MNTLRIRISRTLGYEWEKASKLTDPPQPTAESIPD